MFKVRFFKKKNKIGFLNPKESENGFCVSLLDRLIQDLSDYGASKEPKNPLPEWRLFFTRSFFFAVFLSCHARRTKRKRDYS